MVGRLNGDLANDFGNLAQRVLAMINRNCAAAVPEPGAIAEADERLLTEARGLLARVRPLIAEQQAFHLALETIWRVVAEANRYVDEQAPWALRRGEPVRMGTVLYTLAEVLRQLGILVQPFVPGAAATLLDQLAVSPEARVPTVAVSPEAGVPTVAMSPEAGVLIVAVSPGVALTEGVPLGEVPGPVPPEAIAGTSTAPASTGAATSTSTGTSTSAEVATGAAIMGQVGAALPPVSRRVL